MGNEYVILTGANGGIGREFAKSFAKDHENLILIGRKEEELNEEALSLQKEYGINAIVYAFDLSKQENIDSLFESLEKDGIIVSTLVNNAGYGLSGPFESNSEIENEKMMTTNMISLVHMTRSFLLYGHLASKKRILNVGSVASFAPGPFMALYYASKSFVLSFSEALSEEKKKDPSISISCVCPGPTRTKFFDKAGLDLGNGKKRFGMRESKDLVAYSYPRFKKGKAVIVDGLSYRFLIFLMRFSPRSLVRKIIGKVNHRS